MAKIRKVGTIGEVQGKIGQIVIRYKEGKPYVSTPPVFTKPPTTKQTTQRDKFKQAVSYAKYVMTTPKKDIYKQKMPNRKPFNSAVADYLKAPEIENVDLTNFNGNIGDTIKIYARDDVSVDRVLVTISDGTIDNVGNELESGHAVKSVEEELLWIFTGVRNVPSPNFVITVLVNDIAGNVANRKIEKKRS